MLTCLGLCACQEAPSWLQLSFDKDCDPGSSEYSNGPCAALQAACEGESCGCAEIPMLGPVISRIRVIDAGDRETVVADTCRKIKRSFDRDMCALNNMDVVLSIPVDTEVIVQVALSPAPSPPSSAADDSEEVPCDEFDSEEPSVAGESAPFVAGEHPNVDVQLSCPNFCTDPGGINDTALGSRPVKVTLYNLETGESVDSRQAEEANLKLFITVPDVASGFATVDRNKVRFLDRKEELWTGNLPDTYWYGADDDKVPPTVCVLVEKRAGDGEGPGGGDDGTPQKQRPLRNKALPDASTTQTDKPQVSCFHIAANDFGGWKLEALYLPEPAVRLPEVPSTGIVLGRVVDEPATLGADGSMGVVRLALEGTYDIHTSPLSGGQSTPGSCEASATGTTDADGYFDSIEIAYPAVWAAQNSSDMTCMPPVNPYVGGLIQDMLNLVRIDVLGE